MKMGSFKTCLSCPCLLFLECLVLGTSTNGNNTKTSDRPQLLAMWYQVRRHIISRNREQNRLFTKYFIITFPYVLPESKTKLGLSCFVVSYFLRSQVYTLLSQVRQSVSVGMFLITYTSSIGTHIVKRTKYFSDIASFS